MKSSVKEISLSKKPEDNSKQLESMRKLGSNKQCFDCGEKGTTYVVMTFGTFVCSRCAGLLRDLTYKVKGIGVCNFSDIELSFLLKMGNDNAKAIWLAKFDSKKEKTPDPKDSEAVRKHITLKYKEKRFSVKDPEKVMAGGEVKKTVSKAKKEESEDENESDSEDEKTKKKPIVFKTKKVEEKEKPAKATQHKLTPIHMKNSSQSNAQSNTANLAAKSSVGPVIKKSSNDEGNGWANFSNANTNPVSNNQGGFTFFDSNSNNPTNAANNASNNGNTGKNNFESMFTFTDNSTSNPVQNNNAQTKGNDWGVVWDKPTSPVRNVPSNINTNITMVEPNRGSKIDGTFDFSFVNGSPSTPSNANNTQNNNQFGVNTNIQNNHINNNNNNNQNQNINLNTQFGTQPVIQNNNPQGLNQNLSNVYNNPENSKKKNLDDLDKILGDASLITPVNQMNGVQGGPHSQANQGNQQQMHMNPHMQNSANNMFMQPQMMQPQMMQPQMMQPQMMQQMQMMMMNPQMQNNPQMMQMMQMMMQNMMMGGMGVNPNGMGGQKNDLSDINFGGLNIGGQPQSQSTLMNSPPKEDESSKHDVFKDIYNYSKTSVGRPSTNNTNNMNFNIPNNTNGHTIPQNTQHTQHPQNTFSPTPTPTANANPTSAYNPFDFY